MTIEAMRAVPNDSTSNPLINTEAINRRMALMRKRKSPRVSMVAGKVRITSSGLTSKFKIARSNATIMAVM